MFKTFGYILTGFVLAFCFFAGMSCAFAKDRVYRGKVIDADTKEPIEGAVVVAYWYEAWGTLAGETTRLKDVKETLTDRNGEWTITGPKGRSEYHFFGLLFFIPYTREPEFIFFKPGYCSWPNGFYIDACKEKMQPAGTGGIMEGKNVELPKLIKREDRLRAHRIGPIYDYNENKKEKFFEFLKKQKEFIRLLNQEKRYLGLEEYKYKILEE